MNQQSADSTAVDFAACVEAIEAAYEFMLAYAAQGRDREPAGASPSISGMLQHLADGLQHLPTAAGKELANLAVAEETRRRLDEFVSQMAEDAARALRAVRAVLAAPARGSQLVDNLNASAHLRCVLTDIFVLDEVLHEHARNTAQPS